MRSGGRSRRGAVTIAAVLALTACTAGVPRDAPSGSPSAADAGRSSSAAPGPTPEPTPPTPEPPEPLVWGPLPDELASAQELVTTWTPQQLAGGVTVARYGGTDPATPAALVRELHLAGVILMGDNVAGADQVVATGAAVQQAAVDDGRDWPAVVSVDQEGGTVTRFTGDVTAFPTMMTAGAAVSAEPGAGGRVVADASRSAGRQLRALGLTWVNAPVADVTVGPSDPTIGSRSPSDDPHTAALVVQSAVEGYRAAGIVPVAKHYPGHGSVPVDSHERLPVQDASLAELKQRDLVPFAEAARAGTPVVMMSHVAVEALDPGVPASLSPAAYASLRSDAGFEGVAVTDALDMAAVTGEYGTGGAAVAALAAGADLLLMPADVRRAHAALVAAITDGAVPRNRAEQAAAKVVALQRWQARASGASALGAGSSLADDARAASRALSAAGLTRISGPCSGTLVDGAVEVFGAELADREAFTEAAAQAGLDVVPPGGGGTVVRLVGAGGGDGEADVVVALDRPYPLATSRGGTATLALYGRTPSAFAALVDVLTGVSTAPGALPVAVEGAPEPC